MVTKGLMVTLEARAGKEAELASFLADALPLVEGEPQTIAWLAVRAGESSFAIVDVFPDETGRRAHLDGPVAAALTARASDLLADAPRIEHVDVVATKLPRGVPTTAPEQS
jgi:quinol monooxygenase YgiN